MFMKFGQILKELRIEKQLTQKQLAMLLNVTDTSIRDWENRNIEPNYDTLIKLARIFEITVGQLLGTEEY